MRILKPFSDVRLNQDFFDRQVMGGTAYTKIGSTLARHKASGDLVNYVDGGVMVEVEGPDPLNVANNVASHMEVLYVALIDVMISNGWFQNEAGIQNEDGSNYNTWFDAIKACIEKAST